MDGLRKRLARGRVGGRSRRWMVPLRSKGDRERRERERTREAMVRSGSGRVGSGWVLVCLFIILAEDSSWWRVRSE